MVLALRLRQREHLIPGGMCTFQHSGAYARFVVLNALPCRHTRNNKPPMWEWFIPTIYGDLRGWFIIAIPTLLTLPFMNPCLCDSPRNGANTALGTTIRGHVKLGTCHETIRLARVVSDGGNFQVISQSYINSTAGFNMS